VVVCAVAISVAIADTVGDRVVHTVLRDKALPLTFQSALQSRTWVRSGACIKGRGVPLVDKNGVSKGAPLVLYFQQSTGVLSGFSLRRWQPSNPNAWSDAYWETPKTNVSCIGNTCSEITVVFRDVNTLCNGSLTADPIMSADDASVTSIGDRLSVGRTAFNIPLTSSEAQSKGWLEGNCIGHMGIHHSYISGRSGANGPWKSANMLPIQPMYDSTTGHINAILVQNPHPSTHVTPIGDWEGPFINMLFCKNWCKNTNCGFSDTNIWTSMHFFFRDSKSINCNHARCSL